MKECNQLLVNTLKQPILCLHTNTWSSSISSKMLEHRHLTSWRLKCTKSTVYSAYPGTVGKHLMGLKFSQVHPSGPVRCHLSVRCHCWTLVRPPRSGPVPLFGPPQKKQVRWYPIGRPGLETATGPDGHICGNFRLQRRYSIDSRHETD
jgi:hypothetical protein